MVEIEDIREILIREKNKKWVAENPPVDHWDEYNKRVLKHISPDMVKKPYLPIRRLNQTIWKKMYITPQLELQKNIVMTALLKDALKILLLAILYPFLLVLIIGFLSIS